MVHNARIRIAIDGKFRPYTDGHWVIFDPKGFPTGFMHVDRKHLRRFGAAEAQSPAYAEAREAVYDWAFSDYWSSFGVKPLVKAMEGYTLKLVSTQEFDALIERHLGREAEGQKERQHGSEAQAG
ncbi:hypothetical protein ACGF8D_10600 [Streptomyces massasporeus]|uniref:hypothetical protein n=1 Tax=Streptomyces massasporeus TaxID=67324 RepID=UPI00371DD601